MEIQEQINDLIEYKRLVIKLEDELAKKNSEITILSKHNSDLKSLCQDLQTECDDLNKKLISKNSELKKLEKKQQEDLDNIHQNFEKQKEIYEAKILKLSSINPMNKEISIKREVQIRYEEKLKEKNSEIEILKKQIKSLNDDNFELKLEINNIIKNQQQLNNMKEENDLEDLVKQENDEKKEQNKKENENKFIQLQFIIKEKEEKIDKLFQEINKIKSEKNIYELNLSKKYFLDLSQLKEQENKNNLLKRELSIRESEIKNIEKQLLNLQEIVEKTNQEKEEILKDNNNLLLKIKDLEKEIMNNEEIQKDLDYLRDLVQKYESEQHTNNLINEKIKKQNEEKSKNKIIELQRKLEESKSMQSNIVESNILKNNNNYINYIEYNNFEQGDDIFKKEYEKIHQKYKLLLIEDKRRENDLREKEEENEMLNNYLKESIRKCKTRKEKYEKLKEKYKVLLDKKEHYKEICKIARQNMENIINLLNPEQKKNIENSENKYLIDLDSFSFTEII